MSGPANEHVCARCQHVKSAHLHGGHGGIIGTCKLQSCTCTGFEYVVERRATQDDLREQAQTAGGGVVERRGSAAAKLPTGYDERKALPIATGVLDYFPKALAAVAHCSKVGNDQHNKGEPLHWAREKSTDEANTLIRHFIERGTFDTDGVRHSAKVAWRALALLEKEIEADLAKTAQ